MVAPIIILSIGGLMLFWFLYEKCKAYSLKATFIKTGTSLLFIILCAYGFTKTSLKVFPSFAIVGLALGMLGDVFLELKCVIKDKDNDFTIAGFVSFGLGHVFYITGMYLEFYRGQNVLYVILPLALGLLMGPGSMLVGKVCKLDYGKFKPIVFAYAILLFSMSFSTISLWIMSGFATNGMLLLFIGGILFAVSDLVLNPTYFGNNHEKPLDFIINGVIYYSAQYLIAFSILLL